MVLINIAFVQKTHNYGIILDFFLCYLKWFGNILICLFTGERLASTRRTSRGGGDQAASCDVTGHSGRGEEERPTARHQ